METFLAVAEWRFIGHNVMIIVYLKTRGITPSEHPVSAEIVSLFNYAKYYARNIGIDTTSKNFFGGGIRTGSKPTSKRLSP